MDLEGLEDIGETKNIVREIFRDCLSLDIKVEEPFILYCIQLIRLDPRWGISNEQISRSNVQRIVHYWVHKMGKPKVPSIITLKIQDLYLESVAILEKVTADHRARLLAKLKHLKNDIFEQQIDVGVPEQKEKFLKKVIFFITLLSGMGNPVNSEVFKEVEAALKSVFFDSDIEEFVSLTSKTGKTERLMSLMKLVSGIRLYNKECHKGGESIEDLFILLESARAALLTDLHRVLMFVMQRVNTLTTAVENCYVLKHSDFDRDNVFMDLQLPENITADQVEHTKELLLLYRQYELFTRQLISELRLLRKRVSQIKDDFNSKVTEMKKIIFNRTAIPATQIYPLFNDLANLWENLQNETVISVCFNQVLIQMQSSSLEADWPDEISIMVGPGGPITDTERQEKTSQGDISTVIINGEVLLPEQFSSPEEFEQIELKYLGFCPWKFIEMEGALIPGNRKLGIFTFENKNYALSSLEAARAFSANPKMYAMQILTFARKNPHYINFLNVLSDLIEVQEILELYVKPEPVIITHDVECQTELHPIPKNIVLDYSWNIWEWKRRAIRLTNLSECTTKHTQTVKSYYRNTYRTQTVFKGEKELQTQTNNYTSMPKLSNFIFGLRGRKDDRQFIIELTRPI